MEIPLTLSVRRRMLGISSVATIEVRGTKYEVRIRTSYLVLRTFTVVAKLSFRYIS